MLRTHELNVSQDHRSLFHPYTPLEQTPDTGALVMKRGDGIYVEDDQGKRYLEAMSGLWCTSLGFSEQRLADAATRQLQALPYYQLFAGRSNEPSIELSHRLIEKTRHLGMVKAMFANSGSEANDQAVKMIWYYFNSIGKPAKKKLIARERAYHGVTVMAASLTGLAGNHADFDLPIGERVLRTACPSHYHYGRPGESEAQFVQRIVGELEDLIEREGAHTIAAFFAEPVQGAGGVIVPPPGYWEKVQAVLRRHDILLVADEVITGFGRVGEWFGCDAYGIRPDLMTLAKALSSAYLPISATLVNATVYEGLTLGSRKNGLFSHGVTYAGHPVCAAVAVETLKLYDERDLIGHVQRVAPHFQLRLKDMEHHPMVQTTRGVGLVGALELAQDKATRKPFDVSSGIMMRVHNAGLQVGLICRPLRDAMAVSPPLIISAAQIDELFAKLLRSLDIAMNEARAAGLMP